MYDPTNNDKQLGYLVLPCRIVYVHVSDCLTDVRQSLAAPRLAGKQDVSVNLNDLLSTTQTSCLEQIKSVLGNLQVCNIQIHM